MLRVSSSTDLHPDGRLAEAFLFVYPRQSSLLQAYVDAFIKGAMQMIVLILNRNDYNDFEAVLGNAFSKVEIMHDCGLPPYEVLAVASQPKVAPSVPWAG